MTTAIANASHQAIDLALSIITTTDPGPRTFKNSRDFATAADQKIEEQVAELLQKLTPDVPFLGEEYGGNESAGTYWCLDPIDGTTNYYRGIPTYGISLAYIENNTIRQGEIALPAIGERYFATPEKATLNGNKIAVRSTASLDEAIIAIGDFATGPESEGKNKTRLATLSQLANRVQRIRMLGSAAIDLAFLAAGRLDAVIMHSNNTWDVAAGIALAQAAGAIITTHNGAPYTTHSTDLLAAAPTIYQALWTGTVGTTV